MSKRYRKHQISFYVKNTVKFMNYAKNVKCNVKSLRKSNDLSNVKNTVNTMKNVKNITKRQIAYPKVTEKVNLNVKCQKYFNNEICQKRHTTSNFMSNIKNCPCSVNTMRCVKNVT